MELLDKLKKKQREELKNTVFAKYAGACFECCDFENMYDEIEKFTDQVRSETAEMEREKLRVKIYDYLKKICWTEKDIEYFMRANQLNK